MDTHKSKVEKYQMYKCGRTDPGKYVLKINFFIESGPVVTLQYNIHLKTKSVIFFPKTIREIES